MSTIVELLSGLQEPYKSQALKNYNESFNTREEHNVKDALDFAFDWESSPEGYDYWDKLFDSL